MSILEALVVPGWVAGTIGLSFMAIFLYGLYCLLGKYPNWQERNTIKGYEPFYSMRSDRYCDCGCGEKIKPFSVAYRKIIGLGMTPGVIYYEHLREECLDKANKWYVCKSGDKYADGYFGWDGTIHSDCQIFSVNNFPYKKREGAIEVGEGKKPSVEEVRKILKL